LALIDFLANILHSFIMNMIRNFPKIHDFRLMIKGIWGINKRNGIGRSYNYI